MEEKIVKTYGVPVMFAVLSMSMLINTPTAVAPAMSLFFEKYAGPIAMSGGDPGTIIPLILTLPKLACLIFTLISTYVLSPRINNKLLALCGLALISIGGLAGVVVNNITVLLVFRFVMGMGLGTLSPFLMGFIARLWKGDTRNKLNGWKSTFSSLGTMIMAFVCGHLALRGANTSFFVYLLPVIVFILVLIFVPNMPVQKKEDNAAAPKVQMGARNYLLALGIFAYYVTFFLYFTGYSLVVSENSLGDTVVAGTANSLYAIAGILTGIGYHYIFKTTKRFTIPLGIILTGIGFLIISGASSVGMFYLGNFITGIGIIIVTPRFYALAQVGVPQGAGSVKAAGIINIGLDSGCFFASYITAPIFAAMGIELTAMKFHTMGIVFVVAAIILTICIALKKGDKEAAY